MSYIICCFRFAFGQKSLVMFTSIEFFSEQLFLYVFNYHNTIGDRLGPYYYLQSLTYLFTYSKFTAIGR